jgi:hypothetical protein
LQLAAAEQSAARSQQVHLAVGDILNITSNRASIQKVLVSGNVSDPLIQKPSKYPTTSFAIGSSNPGTYALSVIFDFSDDYQINLFVQPPNDSGTRNNSTYYVSGGPFELDVNANFIKLDKPPAVVLSSVSPWESFVGWLDKFGQAFPLWVKLLYLTLGVQFFAVGGLWIRRETARKEAGMQRHDTGDRAFLWIDLAYKFLLFSFLTIVAVMGGEVLVLFILRFMFLASFDLLSLWDLFVVGFAGGVVVIAYLFRFTLEKAFDLKPIEDD